MKQTPSMDALKVIQGTDLNILVESIRKSTEEGGYELIGPIQITGTGSAMSPLVYLATLVK